MGIIIIGLTIHDMVSRNQFKSFYGWDPDFCNTLVSVLYLFNHRTELLSERSRLLLFNFIHSGYQLLRIDGVQKVIKCTDPESFNGILIVTGRKNHGE